MTASLAAGKPALTECIMVISPMSGGNTVVHFVLMEAPNILVAPTVPQHGTQPAVEAAIANIPFRQSNASSQHAIHHDLPTLSAPLNSTDHSLCNPSNISPETSHPQVDLDAIERKICQSLAEDFLHLPADDVPPQLTLWQIVLCKAASLPSPTPVDLDALEMKIQKSLQDDFCHLEANPPDSAPPTHLTTLLPATTTPLPALTVPMVPLLPSNLVQTPTPPAAPLDVPIWVPTDPPTLNNLPDVSSLVTKNQLESPAILPTLRCKQPPGPLAPSPKCAHVTFYSSSHPGGSSSPSHTMPLPPFHPVLMTTPDKYTQHNFCPHNTN